MEVTIPIAFIAGFVSFISPCFLPVVPVFITQLIGDAAGTERQKRAAIINSLAFSAGFTLVFIAMWGTVGAFAHVFNAISDYLRIGGGLIIVLFGLQLTGLINIPILARTFQMAPTTRQKLSLQKGPVVRALILGVVFAASWTPCIGPILAAIIAMATSVGNPGLGLALMLVYSLGLALPLLLLSVGAVSLGDRLNWFKKHHRGVEIFSGILLILIGAMMVTNTLVWLAQLIPPLV